MSKIKYPKIVVSGYIGFDNFGDEAIFKVLSSNLKNFTNNITAISSNPKKTKMLYGVNSCKTFSIPAIVWHLANADYLISGGGSLLQDKTSLKSLLYYLFIILCAKLLGVKVIVFAQGIGPISNNIAKFITRLTLKCASILSVRDEKSLFLLRGWGLNPILQPDPVFNLEIPSYTPQKKVGIQLRNWKFLSEEFLEKLADKIVEHFSNYEILLFSFQDSLDLEICNNFEKLLHKKNFAIKTKIVKNDFPSNITENMKSLEYLIAMRFHACLLGLKFGIKTLAINYDEKVEKLATSAKIPFINLDKSKEFDEKFNALITLNSHQILAFANSQKYDFTAINEFINR